MIDLGFSSDDDGGRAEILPSDSDSDYETDDDEDVTVFLPLERDVFHVPFPFNDEASRVVVQLCVTYVVAGGV